MSWLIDVSISRVPQGRKQNMKRGKSYNEVARVEPCTRSHKQKQECWQWHHGSMCPWFHWEFWRERKRFKAMIELHHRCSKILWEPSWNGSFLEPIFLGSKVHKCIVPQDQFFSCGTMFLIPEVRLWEYHKSAKNKVLEVNKHKQTPHSTKFPF